MSIIDDFRFFDHYRSKEVSFIIKNATKTKNIDVFDTASFKTLRHIKCT